MQNSNDHRQYICGARVVICLQAYSRWEAQRGCDYARKDPVKDKCWYLNGDGICCRDRMEHEGA